MKYLFIIAVFLIAIADSYTQDPYYINYDTKDGLPSSEVYDIEVDDNGLLWFTTDRGICTYDGYTFKNHSSKEYDLADDTNFEIFRDSKNRIWLNGYRGKLSLSKDGTFYPYAYNDELDKTIKQNNGGWVGHIVESAEGELYFSLRSTRNTIHLYRFDEDMPPEEIIIDSLKNVNNIEDVVLINMAGKIIASYFKEFFQTPTKKYYQFYINKTKTYGEDYLVYNATSLFKINGQGKIIEWVDLGEIIGDLYEDDQKNIWVCTFKGVFLFEKGDLSRAPKQYLSDYNVTNLIQDQESNYWISTVEKGIFLIPSFDIRQLEMPGHSTTIEKVLSIAPLEGHLFFGTSNSSVVYIDSSFMPKELRVKGEKADIANLIPWSSKSELKIDHGYLIHFRDGIFEIKLDSFIANQRQQLLNGSFISFSSSTTGFSLFTKNGERVFTTNDNPLEENPTRIIQDADETIWIGTMNGLFKIEDYQYTAFEKILLQGKDPFGRIKDIQIDKANNKWISTIGKGLFYLTDDKTFQISEAEGLNSDFINKITITNDSTVWVATNKGLNVLNYNIEKDSLVYSSILSFTREDGLVSNYINDVLLWNDKIWLATNLGVCYFDLDIVNEHYPEVPISIEGLVVSDSNYMIDTDLEFTYNQNDVFINFTGISFKKRESKPFYRYRLISETETPEWFYTNEKNIRYNDLTPGAYTFEVAAQNKLGVWNSIPASLSFVIRPHFTQTWWFILLSGVLFISVIALIAYFRIRRIRTLEKAKRELQEAQLRIREAELSALRNQMNPHFVSNALNSIQNFIFQMDIDKANYYLSKFSELMRNSLQYTRLDFITLKEEITFLEDYLELEVMRFPELFEYSFSVEEDLPVNQLMIPALLLQPILENAVKHGFKDIQYKGQLEVHITQPDDEHLKIVVRDNGPGLVDVQEEQPANETKRQSFGMEIIKNRIILLNEGNKNQEASVKFFNRSDLHPKDSGLEINFVLPIVYRS